MKSRISRRFPVNSVSAMEISVNHGTLLSGVSCRATRSQRSHIRRPDQTYVRILRLTGTPVRGEMSPDRTHVRGSGDTGRTLRGGTMAAVAYPLSDRPSGPPRTRTGPRGRVVGPA